MPLAACKGLMDREAPNLGAGVGRQGRKRAGFGAGVRPALLQVVRRGCSRSGGLRVSAGDGCRVFFRSQVFRWSASVCKVGFPIACLPEKLSGEKFSGSPKFSAVCRPCVSAYILCKRVKEKMGVYIAYI